MTARARWLPYLLMAVLATALAVGCGGDDSNDSDSPEARTGTTKKGANEETRTKGSSPSRTARGFRRLYEAKDNRACDLVAKSFEPGPDLTCKQAVKRHELEFAIVTLKQGGTVEKEDASLKATVRSDTGKEEGEPEEGFVELKLIDERWRITEIGAS